ncbi:MAG: hypothetical protein E7321_03860 [Clostridiales bacterium]|nr:hypothetical protein [Clostridiales bacterium]
MRCIRCEGCKSLLGNMEIALNLKLRGRAVSRFYCLSCLAQQLGCTRSALEEMAAFYSSGGCELFAREYVCEYEGGDRPCAGRSSRNL